MTQKLTKRQKRRSVMHAVFARVMELLEYTPLHCDTGRDPTRDRLRTNCVMLLRHNHPLAEAVYAAIICGLTLDRGSPNLDSRTRFQWVYCPRWTYCISVRKIWRILGTGNYAVMRGPHRTRPGAVRALQNLIDRFHPNLRYYLFSGGVDPTSELDGRDTNVTAE